jgi:sulfoxide reductase heme-binding subunit YedZ
VHLTSSPVDWYAARAAGIVAYLLLSTGVVLGLSLASGRGGERWPRFALEQVHRTAGLLTGAFVVVHVATVAIDSWLPFSLLAVTVPFAGSYRPVWVGLGVVAAELLLALAVTNRLRERIGYRAWRRLHYANFGVWGAATVHALATGTDRDAPWFLAALAAATFAVGAFTWRRLGLRAAPAAGVLAAGAAVVLATLVFPPHRRPWNALRFTEPVQATISRDAGTTRELVSLVAGGRGVQPVLLRADVLVEPQGALAASFQLEFIPSGLRCTGHELRLTADGFVAHCRAAGGATRTVRLRLAGTGAGTSGGEVDVGP